MIALFLLPHVMLLLPVFPLPALGHDPTPSLWQLATATPFDRDETRFARWAFACGATGLENVFLGSFPVTSEARSGEASLRGLGVAKPHIPKDDPILCMPQECVLPISQNRFVTEAAGKHGGGRQGIGLRRR